MSILRPLDLLVAFRDPSREELCVAGFVLPLLSRVLLISGNLKPRLVPQALFKPSGDGTAPDFNDFEVTDHGLTLRFGPYEAAFDAVLYETDVSYRKKLYEDRPPEERTLGASIRRLRNQRGLSRAGLESLCGLPYDYLHKVEGGWLQPTSGELQVIAEELGVTVEDLKTY